MLRCLLDLGVEFIWARVKTFDWELLIVVHQEVAEGLKDLLLRLKLLVPLHLLNLVTPFSEDLALSPVTFVLVCLLPVHFPQDGREASAL